MHSDVPCWLSNIIKQNLCVIHAFELKCWCTLSRITLWYLMGCLLLDKQFRNTSDKFKHSLLLWHDAGCDEFQAVMLFWRWTTQLKNWLPVLKQWLLRVSLASFDYTSWVLCIPVQKYFWKALKGYKNIRQRLKVFLRKYPDIAWRVNLVYLKSLQQIIPSHSNRVQ